MIGLGGGVATKAAAGIAMIRTGSNSLEKLPLADRNVPGMADYRNMMFAG